MIMIVSVSDQLRGGLNQSNEREHIAPVLCVTSSLLVGDMVISGGEDSILNAVQWNDGERIARIDHHRGPVTCAVINYRQDVLVSGVSMIVYHNKRL